MRHHLGPLERASFRRSPHRCSRQWFFQAFSGVLPCSALFLVCFGGHFIIIHKLQCWKNRGNIMLRHFFPHTFFLSVHRFMHSLSCVLRRSKYPISCPFVHFIDVRPPALWGRAIDLPWRALRCKTALGTCGLCLTSWCPGAYALTTRMTYCRSYT